MRLEVVEIFLVSGLRAFQVETFVQLLSVVVYSCFIFVPGLMREGRDIVIFLYPQRMIAVRRCISSLSKVRAVVRSGAPLMRGKRYIMSRFEMLLLSSAFSPLVQRSISNEDFIFDLSLVNNLIGTLLQYVAHGLLKLREPDAFRFVHNDSAEALQESSPNLPTRLARVRG